MAVENALQRFGHVGDGIKIVNSRPKAKARLSQWWINDLPIVNRVASLINSKIAACYIGFSVSACPLDGEAPRGRRTYAIVVGVFLTITPDFYDIVVRGHFPANRRIA